MIPVLYDEMANLYTGTGTYWNVDPDVVKANIPSHLIGYLADTLSCKVTEERNGSYELILTYPVTGSLFEDILPGRCVMAKAHSNGSDQLFRIYRTTKVLRGILTVYARHISYDLSGIDMNFSYGVIPVTKTPAGWMLRLFQNTFFKGYSDITATNDILARGLMSLRMLLGGVEGSVLDTFGGEFTFDNYEIYLNTARGSNKGVVVEYGKNLTDMNVDLNIDNVYTGIRPCARYYDSNSEEQTIVAPEISTGVTLGYEWTKILDVTEMLGLDSGATPTTAQITTAANAWLAEHPMGEVPNITVSFVDAKTLQRSLPSPTPGGGIHPVVEIPYPGIDLCDTVTVRYVNFGISIQQKVVKTEYNTLLERYDSITLGTAAANLAGNVNDLESAVATLQKEKPTFSSGTKTVDLSDGVVNLYDGTLNSKLTAGIGQRVHSNGSSITLASKTTMTNLNSFTLSKGTWIVSVAVRFNSNATGRRSVSMSDTDSDLSAINVHWGETKNAVNGAYTYLHLCSTVKVTSSSQTYYINAYQNSGGNLDVVAFWDAVRVY